jgi:N-acyl-D-aspartate/D-glutamate deacylase
MPILRQTSTETAQRLGALGLSAMAERGRVQVGAIADLVLFDPETVTDHSTYAEGSRPATGFAYVFVAGQPVLKADRVDVTATPGQALRFPPGSPQ